MMNNHITEQEWQRYFAHGENEADLQLSQRIHSHTKECALCAEFYKKAADLKQAAQAYADLFHLPEMDETPYAAVAAFGAETGAERNLLSVAIDCDEGNAIFLEETLETTGAANTYAINTENDETCLQEDLQAFRLELMGTRLHIQLENKLIGNVQAVIRNGIQAMPITFEGNQGSILLPDNTLLHLEVAFFNI